MELTRFLQVIILNIQLFRFTNANNVIFLSLPYYGHINPMVKVAGELTNFGHTSYIIISEKYNGKFGLVKKGVNFVIVEEFPEFVVFNDLIIKILNFPDKYTLEDSLVALQNLCDRYLLNEKLFLKLKSFNASLAVVDANFVSNCLAVFPYRLQIPFILQGLHNQFNIHRTPWAMSIFPHFALGPKPKKSFSTKLWNVFIHLRDYTNPALGSPGRNIKDYAPERPDISFDELIRQFALYIVDSDLFLHLALPALPNVKYIGGIATSPAKPLKGKILEFVNASKNGVIVVSPGTVVSWDIHVKKMEEAFSRIKYDVVWKHSNSSYSRPNVLLTKWLPQNDLLGHPNTKLFITHCGNSGQYEGLYHAVPMIGFPVLADQLINGQIIQSKRYGISMDIDNFTADELIRNIEEVIENPEYKKNIAKTSEIFRSQAELPSGRVARLVDEIIKYGGNHLRSEIQNIPLYQFLMLDIWAVLFVAGFAILFFISFLLRKCFSIAFCRRKKTKSE